VVSDSERVQAKGSRRGAEVDHAISLQSRMAGPFGVDSTAMWTVHAFIFAMPVSTARRNM
jgi:hypothetical protein